MVFSRFNSPPGVERRLVWAVRAGLCMLLALAAWLAQPRGATGADDSAPGGSDYSGGGGYRHPDNFGVRTGEFNGVPIFCNGPMSPKYFSDEKHEHEGYITGYKWQCVEYIVRYYKQVYGLEIRGGDAWEWFELAGEKDLKRYPNGDRYRPEVGDILCSPSGQWGHVGIIREVGPDYVVVIQQNWSNTSDDGFKRAPMTVRNGIFTIHPFPKSPQYKWQGWLRAKRGPTRQTAAN